MELEQLRAFVAVAEEKSYTKAGERLYMAAEIEEKMHLS